MKHLIISLTILSMILTGGLSFAEIPHYMQFQGKATDADDAPLDGSHNLTFRIYDAESEGNLEWTEAHTDVDVEDGVFSVLLGGVTALDIAFDEPYWISVDINGTGEMPLQRISSVGYAYYASTAKRAEEADAVTDTSEFGKIVQIVNVQVGTVATGTTRMPRDNTIPQNTEGDEYMSLAITPKSATNKLKIDVVCNVTNTYTNQNLTVALFQDDAPNALAAVFSGEYDGRYGPSNPTTFTHFMTAGTTAETTFKVRAGEDNAGTTYFNGTVHDSGQIYDGVFASSITITEIRS